MVEIHRSKTKLCVWPSAAVKKMERIDRKFVFIFQLVRSIPLRSTLLYWIIRFSFMASCRLRDRLYKVMIGQCNRAAMQPCNHAIMQPCNHAIMQPCNHATIQPCNHATMQPCNHASMHPCNHANMQTCKHATMQPCTVPGICSLHIEEWSLKIDQCRQRLWRK